MLTIIEEYLLVFFRFFYFEQEHKVLRSLIFSVQR